MRLYGYVGKIIRFSLKTKEISFVDTYRYVPKYLGGRALINKIFWDEVPVGTTEFDPGNKFIYMTGATTGTGIPTGGRTEACAIGANNLPAQYTWGGIGGWFGAELKFAGYDGFIIEDQAEEPVYIVIDDDKIEIKSARNLWGKKVHETQQKLEEMYGRQFKSMVIGPAGENLVRIATITTSNDNVFGKGGFGAVWGSKNLKAITCRGAGVVVPADINKLMELRFKMSHPWMRPSPARRCFENGVPGSAFPTAEWIRGNVCCSHGCNQHCNCLMMNVKGAFSPEPVNHIEKCVSIFAFNFTYDVPNTQGSNWMTRQNHVPACKMLSREMPDPDPTDPYFEDLMKPMMGDTLNFWGPDQDRGSVWMDLVNEYGMDKWDIIIWLMTWLSMGKKEGVFDDIDFGMEINVESEAFIRHMMDIIVYRKGYYGNLLAEGMARAIRKLGYEKFGNTIYHGRYSNELGGTRLDLPISLETAWGHSYHWQGRGFEGTIRKETWLATSIELMMVTRDCQTIEHHHDTYERWLEIHKDPYHSPALIESINMNERKAQLKDSVTCCDWQSPDLWWTDMEAQMYTAATGYPMSEEEINESAERSKLLFRAILMRNHNRCRDLEMAAIWPSIEVPDIYGEIADWDGFNDLVDLYYDMNGWDRRTGWPYRETWEKYDLKDIADEMERIGKLPQRPEEPAPTRTLVERPPYRWERTNP
jgi:aldehyde:ferredoxin oxidoreductase